MSYRPRHLVVSKIFPIPINFVFAEDLGISYTYNSYHLSITPHTAPNPVFFAVISLGSLSHLGYVRLVFGVFGHRKTVDLNFVDLGMGGQSNGKFVLGFRIRFLYISGFFSHSHHITSIVNKSSIQIKPHIPVGFLSRSFLH